MVDTAQVGVSATDRKAGGDSTAARNVSARVARRGGAVLEDSATFDGQAAAAEAACCAG